MPSWHYRLAGQISLSSWLVRLFSFQEKKSDVGLVCVWFARRASLLKLPWSLGMMQADSMCCYHTPPDTTFTETPRKTDI